MSGWPNWACCDGRMPRRFAPEEALSHPRLPIAGARRRHRHRPVLDEDEEGGTFHHWVWARSGGRLFGPHTTPSPHRVSGERQTGLDQVAFTCGGRNELQQWADRLTDLGIAHEGIKDAGHGSGPHVLGTLSATRSSHGVSLTEPRDVGDSAHGLLCRPGWPPRLARGRLALDARLPSTRMSRWRETPGHPSRETCLSVLALRAYVRTFSAPGPLGLTPFDGRCESRVDASPSPEGVTGGARRKLDLMPWQAQLPGIVMPRGSRPPPCDLRFGSTQVGADRPSV